MYREPDLPLSCASFWWRLAQTPWVTQTPSRRRQVWRNSRICSDRQLDLKKSTAGVGIPAEPDLVLPR
jgi:hypothetical protein